LVCEIGVIVEHARVGYDSDEEPTHEVPRGLTARTRPRSRARQHRRTGTAMKTPNDSCDYATFFCTS
jgi:hypothetical protein